MLAAVERVLEESKGALCDDHALRHDARKLRVYALSSLMPTGRSAAVEQHLQQWASEMVSALDESVHAMSRHLPPAHPELGFFRCRLAEVLLRHNMAPSRAHEEAIAGVEALTIACGADHPSVQTWRKNLRV